MRAGIHVVTELSPQQLDALPGGDMLKAVQLMTPVESWDEDALRTRCARLATAMQSHALPGRHLAAPILITLCQQRPMLCSQFSANNVKLVSEVCGPLYRWRAAAAGVPLPLACLCRWRASAAGVPLLLACLGCWRASAAPTNRPIY